MFYWTTTATPSREVGILPHVSFRNFLCSSNLEFVPSSRFFFQYLAFRKNIIKFKLKKSITEFCRYTILYTRISSGLVVNNNLLIIINGYQPFTDVSYLSF